jgi:hypothetical protein
MERLFYFAVIAAGNVVLNQAQGGAQPFDVPPQIMNRLRPRPAPEPGPGHREAPTAKAPHRPAQRF